MNPRNPIGAGLLVLCLAACGQQAGSDARARTDAPSALVARTFLEKLPGAYRDLAYSGTRSVWMSYDVGGTPYDIEYVERVYSDGLGRFDLVPDEVRVPRMNDMQWQQFALERERRKAFLFLHRDFRVRDLQLFTDNYELTDTGTDPVIAGRACVELAIRHREDGHVSYRAAVDADTGLVMSYEEYALDGHAITRVTFESFTLTPDFQGAELTTSAFSGTPLDVAHAKQQVGFAVNEPSWVPAGYEIVRIDQVNDGTRKWARFVYGDGVEQVFYLFSGHETPTSQHREPLPYDPPSPEPAVVKLFQAGPLCVAEYAKDSQRAIAIGKVGEENLLQLLQSATD